LRRFAVATLEEDTISKTQTLRFGIPVFETNGTLARILYGSVYLRLFSEVLTNISMPTGSTITVLDEAGNVIARQPDPSSVVGKNLRQEMFAREVFRQGEGTTLARGFDGKERLYASTALRDGDGPMLFVAVGIPTNILYAHANYALIRNCVALVVVAAAALALAWVVARESFLKPVHTIRDTANKIALGNLAARTNFPAGQNELWELGHNFDVMAENLERRERELRAASEKISGMNTELEKRVAERTRQLEATNEELEAFSYSVSHDLRAPLRHMDGFAQILLTEPSLENNERAQRYLQMITKAAKQMGVLIDDLLSFSRMGRKTMVSQKVDMNSLVSDVISDLREEQKGRQIEWSIATLPSVEGDGSMLKQVWTNLISNALKYSRNRNPAKIEVSAREEGDNLVFFVRDNGAGFEMAYADKLFGVFQRLHRDEEFEGTGIGLANVRRIVTRHGGRTWAEAEVNRGATFYFSLPKPGKVA
jgi:signal transduction histidine kinase